MLPVHRSPLSWRVLPLLLLFAVATAGSQQLPGTRTLPSRHSFDSLVSRVGSAIEASRGAIGGIISGRRSASEPSRGSR